MGYDLVLHDGRVFEPSTERWQQLHVAVRGGSVAAIAPDIPLEDAKWHSDVSGGLVYHL